MTKTEKHPIGPERREWPGEKAKISEHVPKKIKMDFLADALRPLELSDGRILEYGKGDQLAAAMFLWTDTMPDDARYRFLKYILCGEDYDPAVGRRIKEAIAEALRQIPG